MMYDDLVENEFKLYVKYHFQLSDFLICYLARMWTVFLDNCWYISPYN